MEEIDNKDIISYLKDNSKNWSSGNKEIDAFIQKNQSNVSDNIIFEWIPYNQFSEEIGYEFSTATWKNGLLHFNINKKKWERKSNRKVALKYLNMTKLYSIKIEFLNKFKSQGIGYGISQNNDTKDYIYVFYEKFYEKNFEKYCEKCGEGYTDEKYKWCKPCLIIHLNFTNWTSGNKMINSFIQEEQLKIDTPWDTVFEWVPYNQFIDIEEIGSQVLITAIWKDGPLEYNENSKNYERNLSKKFVLKFFYNSQNKPDELLNKAESYLTTKDNANFYGMSQNPDTKDYILIFGEKYLETCCKNCGENYTAKIYKWCKLCHIDYLKSNFVDWTNKIKQTEAFIDFLQEKKFEWIPYDQFSHIKEIKNIGATAKCDYIAWESDNAYNPDDPDYYYLDDRYIDNVSPRLNKKVVLKYLYNLQYISDEFLSKIKSKDITSIYGISQNPDTKDYILVLHEKYCLKCDEKYTDEMYKWCKPCQIDFLKSSFTNWTSGNKQIDDFIQEKQLQINNSQDIMFEWIPYNQFINIKETEIQNFITAIWSNGPLIFDKESRKYRRNLNKNVTLKLFYDSQNVSIEFLNKMKSHLTEDIISYGISQNPNTKDYILVFCEKYIEKCCKNCGEKYTNEVYKWCKLLCSINEKSMKIFDFIDDFKFNWVPYNEFNDIKEMGRGGFSTVYSAIWGYKKVALKCLHNSHNFINEFLNEVKAYSAYSSEDIIKIYGISQNPDTGDFIMILECAEGGNFNGYLYKNHEDFDWLNKLQILIDIIRGLRKIHQKHMVHRDFHIGNILFKYIKYNNTCISDMGLCKEVGNNDETKIYGVMPYVAPEVLRGGHYTQAADIYSFGMIMYFVATGKQPFSDRAHDKLLALDICNEIRPEINEPKAPKCYIDLMKKCWNSNPNDRPNAFKIEEFIWLFYNSYISNASKFKYIMKIEKKQQHYEIEKQFKEAEEYRKENPISIKDIQSTTHPQAIYTSRLLNSFTNDLPSECLDCAIDDL